VLASLSEDIRSLRSLGSWHVSQFRPWGREAQGKGLGRAEGSPRLEVAMVDETALLLSHRSLHLHCIDTNPTNFVDLPSDVTELP